MAAPVIDGAIDDEAWSAASLAGGYLQRDPDNGTAMTEQTRIQVVYDDRHLYIAVVCEDSSPGDIAAALSRREDFGATDFVGIGFDPRHDHLTAYVFQSNASAVQADLSMSDDDRIDREYNAVWDVHRRTGTGARCGDSRASGPSGGRVKPEPGHRTRGDSGVRSRSTGTSSSTRR